MELSTFRSESVALRMAQYMVLSICYNLMIMGVPISSDSNVFIDNKEFCNSTRWPEAALKKNMCPFFMMYANQFPVCDTYRFVKG